MSSRKDCLDALLFLYLFIDWIYIEIARVKTCILQKRVFFQKQSSASSLEFDSYLLDTV